MKAVVLEVRGKEAVVLKTDGEIIKIKQKNLKTGDTIELSEKQAKGKTISYREIWRYGSIAAAAALFLGCGGMYSYNNVMACSYVSLDIEPSIEYTLNRKNLVLDVTALNDEATEIVQELKAAGIKQASLSEVMEKTAELLEKYGYMDADETDYVLINVSCDSEKQRELLKEEASTVFDNINKADSDTVNVTVTESTVSERKNAKSLGISSGEYQEIRKIKENETATSKPEISADDIDKYSGLGVQELLESSGQLEKKNAQTSENPAESRNADNHADDTNAGKTNDTNTEKKTTDDTTENQEKASQNFQNNAGNLANDSDGETAEQKNNDISGIKNTPQNNIQPENQSSTTPDNSRNAAPSEVGGNNGSEAPGSGNDNGDSVHFGG